MSKNPKRRVAATCSSCRRNFQATPAALLGQLAGALNAIEALGGEAKLKHGIVETRDGYVLPTRDGWVARSLVYAPFSPPEDDSDED